MGRGDLAPRIITNFAVKVCSEGEGVCFACEPVNLSETGACVRLKKEAAPGQAVKLQVQLPQQIKPMEMAGKIVWVRRDNINKVYYCGIGFNDLSEEQLYQIQSYVELGAGALLEFLAEFPLFKAISREDCRGLLQIVTLRELKKKEILYVEGTQDVDLMGLFIVQEGLLSIYKGRKPRQEKQLAVVSPGQIFGETTLIEDHPHTATVRAVNDSRLIQLNKLGFQLLRRERPVLALDIMEVVARVLAGRLGRTTEKLFSPVRGENIQK